MSRDRLIRDIVGFIALTVAIACDHGETPLGPGSNPALRAANVVQAGFKTFFELRCRPGHDGSGDFTVTRNGEVIGRLTLNCTSGKTVAGMVTTNAQPNDWEMSLTVVRLSDGRTRMCTHRGTEFPATRRCSPSPLGINASVTVPRPVP
ncbi:MAG: hypothetical protein L0271_11285 [Gemmatimonadetes bacterium]|nr:hypothetical protein [Gemmatimonadota bacterium]